MYGRWRISALLLFIHMKLFYVLSTGLRRLLSCRCQNLQDIPRKLPQKNSKYLSEFLKTFYSVLNLCLKQATAIQKKVFLDVFKILDAKEKLLVANKIRSFSNFQRLTEIFAIILE